MFTVGGDLLIAGFHAVSFAATLTDLCNRKTLKKIINHKVNKVLDLVKIQRPTKV